MKLVEVISDVGSEQGQLALFPAEKQDGLAGSIISVLTPFSAICCMQLSQCDLRFAACSLRGRPVTVCYVNTLDVCESHL